MTFGENTKATERSRAVTGGTILSVRRMCQQITTFMS